MARASRQGARWMIAVAGALACTMPASASGPGFSYIALDRHIVQTTYKMISSSAAGLFDEALFGASQNTVIGKTHVGGLLFATPFSVQDPDPDNHGSHGSAASELHATFELFEPTQVAITALVSGTGHYDGGENHTPDVSVTLSPLGGAPVFTTPVDPVLQQGLFTFNQMLDPGQWSLDVRAAGGECSSSAGTLSSDGQIEFEMTISVPPVPVHFAPAANFPVGVVPASVVAADFNNDGDIDLATANFHDNRVSTLLNDGSGSFLPEIISVTGHHPALLTAADFDGDGDTDLAVTTGAVPGEVSALLNNGSGFFIAAATSVVGHNPSSIVSADFDSDGDIDLVVATSGTLCVLFNDGSGNFAPAVDLVALGVSGLVNSVTAADFNNDGHIDLATANNKGSFYLNNSASVLFNDGAGGFAPAVDFDVSGQPLLITAADFDADGDTDLAVTSVGKISTLLNNGAGDFSTAVSYVGVSAIALTAADFDGDGDIDLATSNDVPGADGSVSVLVNDGSGDFIAASNTLPVQMGPRVTSADLDHDASPDLVTVNVFSNTVSVLINQTVLFPNGVDLNSDGVVNGADLALLISLWGAADLHGDADLNSDGVVNGADLSILLVSWTG